MESLGYQILILESDEGGTASVYWHLPLIVLNLESICRMPTVSVEGDSHVALEERSQI